MGFCQRVSALHGDPCPRQAFSSVPHISWTLTALLRTDETMYSTKYIYILTCIPSTIFVSSFPTLGNISLIPLGPQSLFIFIHPSLH